MARIIGRRPPSSLASVTPRFRFWFITGATAITVGVTGSLGVWQLGRAEQKRVLEASIQAGERLPPLDNVAFERADVAAGLHRSVQLRGHWVAASSVFLDNRPMAGRTGFFLVTPLRLTGSGHAVLVQRGWVPRDFLDRTRVPQVPTPDGEVVVSGRLAPPPSRLFEFVPAETGPIRQNLDLDQVAKDMGVPLSPLSVLQTGESPEGLLREWPRFESGVAKHHGYAAQWFGMSAIAAGLYVWFQLISPRRRRKPHGQDPR